MNIKTKIISGFLYLNATFHATFGKVDKAIALYERRLVLNPHDLSFYTLIAAYYTDRQQYDRAKQLLEQALVLDPTNSDVNKSYIDVLYQTGTPVKLVIPYIRTYFAQKPPPVQSRTPLLMKILAKLLKPTMDLEASMQSFENSCSRWDMWAYSVLRRYDEGGETAPILDPRSDEQ